VEGGEPAEVAIPIGVQAPGLARSVVAERLADQVAPSVLETALLLVSELVSNGVRHSGVPGGDVVVRVQLWRDGCRLEVEDPGRDGVIAPQPPDPLRGGGMGLQLVQTLSERWGLERVAAGGTRVWAQLASAPLIAPARAEPSGGRAARSPRHGSQTTGTPRPTSAAADERKPMTELHVIPDERTTWRVYDRNAKAPISEHTSATEAELAARALAQDRDADRVVVHDRYNRTRDAAPSPTGVSAREQRARARQLALVREHAHQLVRGRPR
jgi:anti-sigma regulatory factor (Ser/Thr protein kinase)